MVHIDYKSLKAVCTYNQLFMFETYALLALGKSHLKSLF